MKRALLVFLTVLLVGICLPIPPNSVAMAADTNEVEDNPQLAACVQPQLIYQEKNSATKEITFIAKGTPGGWATLYVNKYLGGLLFTNAVQLDSTGTKVITFTISNGSYEATLEQDCGGSVGPLFFTMN